MTKKTSKILLFTISTISLIILLTGCTEEQQTNDKYTQRLIGTWSYFEGGQLTFTSDLTVTITNIARLQTMNLDGTYNFAINGNEITFSNTTNQISFEFSFGENTLNLTDQTGGTLTFEKV